MQSQHSYKNLNLKLHIGPWSRDIKHNKQITRMRMMGSLKYIDEKDRPDFFSVIQLEHRTSGTQEMGYQCRTMIGRVMGKEDEISMFTQESDLWCSNCWFKDPDGDTGGIVVPKYLQNRYFGVISGLPPCTGCDSFFAAFEDRIGTPYKTIFGVYHEPILYKAVEQTLAPHGGLEVKRILDFTSRMDIGLKQEIVARAMCPERVASILDQFGHEGLEASF